MTRFKELLVGVKELLVDALAYALVYLAAVIFLVLFVLEDLSARARQFFKRFRRTS